MRLSYDRLVSDRANLFLQFFYVSSHRTCLFIVPATMFNLKLLLFVTVTRMIRCNSTIVINELPQQVRILSGFFSFHVEFRVFCLFFFFFNTSSCLNHLTITSGINTTIQNSKNELQYKENS